MKKSFWKFPQYAKWNVLDDKHTALILSALADPVTGIERVDELTYTVYGPEEALLVRSTALSIRLGMLCLLQMNLLCKN